MGIFLTTRQIYMEKVEKGKLKSSSLKEIIKCSSILLLNPSVVTCHLSCS